MTPRRALVQADGLQLCFPQPGTRRGGRAVASIAVGPIDLAVHGGETCVVTGASLSGKTVLLGAIAGLYQPSGGTLTISAANTGRSHWAVVPQAISLIEGLTIAENIQIDSRLGLVPAAAREWTDHIVEQLDLGALWKREPRQASYGERHRIMLARALSTRPTILLVDEPFAHQDPEMCATIAALVGQATDSSSCSIVTCRRTDVTHWPDATTVELSLRP